MLEVGGKLWCVCDTCQYTITGNYSLLDASNDLYAQIFSRVSKRCEDDFKEYYNKK